MAGKPTSFFYVAVFAVVLGLIGFAAYQARDIIMPAAGGGGGDQIDLGQLEAPDEMGVTTVKEYSFKPSERLPAVKGTAAYKPMDDSTVRFALNVWAGWAPIIQANDGFKAGKVWKTPDGEEFKVELVLIDNPVAMRDAYAAGEVHIGWATLDMMPLLMEGFVKRNGEPIDSRVMPRIFQQIDWSNGGDGIVARNGISSIGDLRGKTIVLAENSPSEYFVLNMLVYGGVQPSEVTFRYTNDAFEAAAAFNSDKNIDAVVTWAPDIFTLSEVKGNKLVVSTVEANKLIADIWFARADFAQENPGICEGLVRGIFDAMVELNTDDGKKSVAKLMADGYTLPEDEAFGMLADAHSTNWGENYEFLMNQNNPTNFERIWDQAYYIYKKTRKIKNQKVKFDRVMDFSIIEKLGKEKKYSNQTDEYSKKFIPSKTSDVRGAEEILTNTVVIHFFPNSSEIYKTVTKNVNGKEVETAYDPKVDLVLEEIAKLAGQFGTARIVIEGHTDSSMKGRAPAELVEELSRNRADAVKGALVKKFELDADQFNTDGVGWKQPADPEDPLNHAQNRRVEIKVYPAESLN